MKILIIDRDEMFSSLLATKMRAAGHEVIETPVKQDGIGQIGTSQVDAVYFDPAPLSDPRSILLQIRRMVNTYPYLVMLGKEMDRAAGIKSGCHDGLPKPLDPEALKSSLENAERMCALIRRLGDVTTDFPSAGGVISKSAFNQLFISSMERVSRNDESSRVMFIRIANFEDIKLDDGKFASDFATSNLAYRLGRLRRQSDILAQTDVNEYALLILRPQNETEALEAARRFAAAMENIGDMLENGLRRVEIETTLIDLPTGALDFHYLSETKEENRAA